MIDSQKKNVIEKNIIFAMIRDLDAGKAIVAAIAVAAIGYLVNILTKLYMFAYWGAYFEFYNIPFEYFANTEVFSVNIYAVLISFLISIIYLFILSRYYKLLAKYDKRAPQNHQGYRIAVKIGRFGAVILLPAVCAFFFFVYLLILTDSGYGPIQFRVCTFSMIFTLLITIFYGVYILRTSYGRDKIRKSIAFSVENLLPITTMVTTVLVFTLLFVYLFGYFQTIIDLDIPPAISVEGEEDDRQYALLLNMKDAYFCIPVVYEDFEGDENGDSFMHLKNDSYRIVPKDISVTISDTNAWLVYADHGHIWISDVIGDSEGILGLAMLFCIVMMILLLFLETKCLLILPTKE